MELKRYKLGEIGEIRMCKRILKEETNSVGGVPFFKIGTFGGQADVFITKEKFEEYKNAYSYPKKGDVLISAAGTIGRTVVFDGKDAYFQDSNIVWIENDESKVLNEYLFYCYKNIRWTTSVGSTILRLYNDDIRNTDIIVPPLSEQKKIASVLSALDDKIALNKKMNQKLEAMAKRLYDYWFVQYDFPDKNGRPYKTTGGPMTYNPTLKREIPVGWEVKTLDEYLDCNKYSLTAKSSYDFIQYLDTSSLTENTLESLQRYGSQAESPSRAKRIVHANDILYSTVRPQQKHYGIIKNPAQNMIASTGFAILSCKYGSEYNDMFYLFLIQEKNLIKLSAIADSNASSYPSFNPSDLLDLTICLPNNLKIIEPLVKKFSSLFSIVERNQKENQKLTALRDKLLPLLMNGQVVVAR